MSSHGVGAHGCSNIGKERVKSHLDIEEVSQIYKINQKIPDLSIELSKM